MARAGVWLALAWFAHASARLGVAQPSVPLPATLAVEAVGEVERDPDQAELALAVETTGPTAREAGQRNAEAMARVLAALVAAGAPREAIRTGGYRLEPLRDPDNPSRLRGYRAINSVRVSTGAFDRLGPWIDAALGAGANRVAGLSFSLRDPRAAEREALRQAVAEARRRAELMAQALGAQLGPVREAVHTAASAPFPVAARVGPEAGFAVAAPTPIAEPEALRVSASVRVVWELRPR
jgi:uncharacterized protein YggE